MKLSEFKKKFEEENRIDLSYKLIATILGYTKQYISQIKNKELSQENLIKLNNYFTKLIDKSSEKDFIDIPVRGNVSASLGYGIEIYDEEKTASYSISKKLARDLSINVNTSEMILAKGDSMYPTIQNGDTLLIDLSRIELYDGAIYCIRLDGQLYAKRLQRLDLNTILVISDNEKYETRKINLKDESIDFQIIGEIRWFGRIL